MPVIADVHNNHASMIYGQLRCYLLILNITSSLHITLSQLAIV